MSGKFVKVKKVVLPALVLVAIAMQTSSDTMINNSSIMQVIGNPPIAIEIAYAAENSSSGVTDITQFSDYGNWSTHWGLQDIQTLVLKGGIKGIPNDDGTFSFKPDEPMKTVDFLALILNTSGNAPTGSKSYYDNVINKAIEMKLIDNKGWVTNKDELLTRERMASLLFKTAVNVLKEDVNQAPYDVDESNISDLQQANENYQDSIVYTYNLGLIAGTGEGFNPKGTTTRAATCAVINRLFKYTDRVDNSDLCYSTSSSTGNSSSEYIKPGEGCYGGVISQYPIEGDVINGVTVTRDPNTGVLGYGNGQKGGIYLGVEVGNTGYKIQVGTSSPADIYYGARGNENANGYYTQYGDYVYWDKEWNFICGYVTGKLNAEHYDAPEGTCADIYGNILDGVTDKNNKDVFFRKGSIGWACIRF